MYIFQNTMVLGKGWLLGGIIKIEWVQEKGESCFINGVKLAHKDVLFLQIAWS